MTGGEPINFDFTPGPPKAEGDGEAGGERTEGEQAAGGDAAETGADAAALPAAGAAAETSIAPGTPAAGAATTLPHGAIPDFRQRDYPFATTSRFQRQAHEAMRPAPVSRRRRLAWGVMAAVGAVVFVVSVVIVLRAVDAVGH